MRVTAILLRVSSILLYSLAGAQSNSQFNTLYESHRWFELRTAVGQANAPSFYRGAIAASFNDPELAQKHLDSVILSAPRSDDAYRARELLTYLFMRSGRYHRALEQIEAMLSVKPDDASAQNAHLLLAALGRYPEQSVTTRRYSRASYRISDGNLFLPVVVNGKSSTYMLDSGADVSAISESEAKRLGLNVRDIGAKGQDVTGGDVAFRLAVADQLTIGGTQLTNVAFLVISDDHQPFVDSPPDERGIIGMPVLLALETVRWDREKKFESGFAPGTWDIKTANVCFDGADIVTEARVQDHNLSLVIDTGASTTRFWPPFARDFPGLLPASEKKGATSVSGVGRTVELESVTLPVVKLRIGGLDVVSRPGVVLLKETGSKSHWLHGNLGLDLLGQAKTVTIDFAAMTLHLD